MIKLFKDCIYYTYHRFKKKTKKNIEKIGKMKKSIKFGVVTRFMIGFGVDGHHLRLDVTDISTESIKCIAQILFSLIYF